MELMDNLTILSGVLILLVVIMVYSTIHYRKSSIKNKSLTSIKNIKKIQSLESKLEILTETKEELEIDIKSFITTSKEEIAQIYQNSRIEIEGNKDRTRTKSNTS